MFWVVRFGVTAALLAIVEYLIHGSNHSSIFVVAFGLILLGLCLDIWSKLRPIK